MQKIFVRNIEENDVQDIVRIFENHYANSIGYVPRTPELWKYLILDRPGVSKHSVYVAYTDDKIMGYLVVAAKKEADSKVATIYEFCAKNEATAQRLLDSAIDYARAHNVDHMMVQPCSTDSIVNNSLRKSGFIRMLKPTTKVMFTLIDPVKIIETLVEAFKDRNAREFRKVVAKRRTVLIKVDDSYLSLCIQNGEIKVKGGSQKANIMLEMTSFSFLGIFLGFTSPLKAYLTGKLKIKGLHSFISIFKLIRLLQPYGTFFFPETEQF